MALADTWLKEFEEAMQMAEDVTGRLRERDMIVSSGGDPSQLVSSTRRKITVLGTCLDRLESLLQNPPEKPRLNEEELYRRQDMLLGIRFKTKQMAASFSTSLSNRAITSLGENTGKKSAEPAQASAMGSNTTLGLPNQGISTTRHATVDVAEDVSLHTCLLSESSDVPESQLKGSEGKEPSKGCSLQLSCLIFLGILVLLLLVWTIIRIW